MCRMRKNCDHFPAVGCAYRAVLTEWRVSWDEIVSTPNHADSVFPRKAMRDAIRSLPTSYNVPRISRSSRLLVCYLILFSRCANMHCWSISQQNQQDWSAQQSFLNRLQTSLIMPSLEIEFVWEGENCFRWGHAAAWWLTREERLRLLTMPSRKESDWWVLRSSRVWTLLPFLTSLADWAYWAKSILVSSIWDTIFPTK